MAELLGGRAAIRTVLDWRRGRRRAPIWAIEVLQEALRARVQRETQSIEELEQEKSTRLSGKMGANAREQIEIAFENVKAALASVGASFEQVVKLNNYVADIGTNLAHYREVRDRYVNKAAPPASTTIGVPQLARPGALFEVEAIAILLPN
jgi:hypothetical protein